MGQVGLVGRVSNPFQEVVRRDLAVHLYALVDQLDLETREVVHLHYYQELSLQETADVLAQHVMADSWRKPAMARGAATHAY